MVIDRIVSRFTLHFAYMGVAICCTVNALAAENSAPVPSSEQTIVQNTLALAGITINGNNPWDITVHNEDFYSKVLAQGSLGFGESYMDGWWDCQRLDECMTRILAAKLEDHIQPSFATIWALFKANLVNLQDRFGSMKVINEHYELGNDLYTHMLDTMMAYSCGYWKNAPDLNKAQEAKFDLICRKLGFKPGMKVLDIGCGWGGFEKYAAKNYGVEIVGVTLSKNQAEFARTICQGLPVDIRIQDYRDVEGTFDRVLEIGMFEHVGEKNYRAFMEICHRCLKPGGLFMLHTIGTNQSTCVTDPWIHKYIFANSHLPSISQIGKSIEGLFVMEDWHNFGAYYDTTLMAWFTNFDRNWDKLKGKYSERFYRMWKYYLLSCAGAFRSRQIQLWQVVLSKDGVPGVYETHR